MIKWLIHLLLEAGVNPGYLRLGEYITFRILMALTSALVFNLLFGHRIIYFLHAKGMRDTSGDLQTISVHSKRGTPTAGGIMILAAFLFSLLLWADLANSIVWILFFGTLYLGMVGFLDDFQKSRFKSSLSGISQMGKTILILVFAVPFALYFVSPASPVPQDVRTLLFVPFMKAPVIDIGIILFFVFCVFTLFSIINAVNITDGLDGLAGNLSTIVIAVYGLFAYIVGSTNLAKHFLFPAIPGCVELSVCCGAFTGAILGFLWYNSYPAEVFMGDTGSLSMGGFIAMACFLTKQELLFLITGGIFILEIFSSLLNEKLANRPGIGRRIVHRAPFHYTLLHRGVAEPKAVYRLYVIGILLAAIALLSIKVR